MKCITMINHSIDKKVFVILTLFFVFWRVLIAGAQTFPSGFNQQLVASGFTKPTVFAFAPDGRLFVAEQTGRVKIIKNGSVLTRPFIRVNVSSIGERGLLGIAFDPAFTTNHYVYLYYTLASKVNNRISRFTASGDTVVPGSETVVLDLDSISNVNHNGGFMQFGPDGKLYVCAGDNRVDANAQNLDTYLGKILRINKDGSIPAGNPFTTGSTKRRSVWAYGVRNPYTLAFQPGTGRFFMNDVGTSYWEEVNNCTTGGNNYGWPHAEGMSTNPNYTNPIYTYPHGSAIGEGCAITGGTFFSPASTNYPGAYMGKYFFLDFCGNWIDMLSISGTSVTRSNFATGIAGFALGMTVGPDGNIYYMSRATGSVYKIIFGPPVFTSILNPVADAYVRGGTYSNTNYGATTNLFTQMNTGAASNYETFVRFDLTSFSGTVSSAKLRIYGGLNNTNIPSLDVEAHNSSNITWQENAITWNTKPAADANILATTTISGTAKGYYEWDITSKINTLKNAGATAVTIKLNNTAATGTRAVFSSREAINNKPQLVIEYTTPRLMDDTQTDANLAADFDIFPNPAGNFFNISLKNIKGNATMGIYDLKGQLLMKKLIENSSYERIDTESLENGIYLVTVTDEKEIITKKVFVNKGGE